VGGQWDNIRTGTLLQTRAPSDQSLPQPRQHPVGDMTLFTTCRRLSRQALLLRLTQQAFGAFLPRKDIAPE